MSNANFRIDTASSLKLVDFTQQVTSAGTATDLLNLGSGRAAIIDSIYAHSRETTLTTKFILNIQDSGGGTQTRRPFFVAQLGPKETVLCASKSTPIAVSSGQKITMTNSHSSGVSVDSNVYISYREYVVS